ncbi:hypothetical protein [Amycolatopsis sp. CA-230715]|uniref:hypothetical protein n=1 Tax=Amycolatopsis sp. CA-230715 TaxID=2745196 RepID=UPI001C00C3CD|nr:hypothetical protein [Amycolatopsis sp. CA-230715]QWF82770.1 hypothetical protein HUW46_06209 [Amycolatopsis sp. CA-230715]
MLNGLLLTGGVLLGAAALAPWLRSTEFVRSFRHRRGPVGDLPRIHLAHLDEALSRGSAYPGRYVVVVWRLYPIEVRRPLDEPVVREVACPYCGEEVPCTIRAAQSTRRRRTSCLVVAAAASVTCVFLAGWGLIDFDPDNGPRIMTTVFGMVGALVVGAFSMDLWWIEDGVSLHGRSLLRALLRTRYSSHSLRVAPA